MNKSFSVKELAECLGGQWQGQHDYRVNAIADITEAGPLDVAFVARKRYEYYLQSAKAGIVIVHPGVEVPDGANVIRVDDPYLAYAKVSGLFSERPSIKAGIHATAIIDPTAKIAGSACIGPNCVIEAGAEVGEHCELYPGVYIGAGTRVGDNCLLYANVVVYHGVLIGSYTTIHSATVVGSDGFGFAPSENGWVKIHQLGGVRIGNNVEIGASCTIDRGALHDTCIDDGVIIDNQVHIAHNVEIGKNSAIAGCSGIAGSTKIGANCTVGGFCAINGHVTLSDDVHINGGSVVTKSLSAPGAYASGTPLQEVRLWRKNSVRTGQLDEWVGRIKKLEKTSGE